VFAEWIGRWVALRTKRPFLTVRKARFLPADVVLCCCCCLSSLADRCQNHSLCSNLLLRVQVETHLAQGRDSAALMEEFRAEVEKTARVIIGEASRVLFGLCAAFVRRLRCGWSPMPLCAS
jgi:hypothetical protein